MTDSFNIIGSDKAKEDLHKREMRDAGKVDLISFGKLFLPNHFNLSTLAPFHVKYAESLLDPTKRWVCNVLPRGFAKSVISGTAVLYYLYYNPVDVAEFIMYVSESRQQALDRIAFLKYNIKNNPRLLHYFGELMNNKCKDTEAEFSTFRGDRVLGMGAGQKGRGRATEKGDRLSKIIPDDFESELNTKTQESRQYIKDWLKGTIIPALDERKGSEGRVWLAGTIVHYDTYLQEIVDGWRNAQEDGKDYIWHVNFARAEENGKATWEDYFPMPKLKQLRELLGNSKYAQEMLNEARDPKTAEFKVDRLNYAEYDIIWNGGFHYVLHKDEAIPVNVNFGIDLAYKEQAEHDFQVIMPIAKDYLGRIWLGDYFCEHYPLDLMAEKAVHMAKTMRPLRVEVEDVGAQGIIKPQMEFLQQQDRKLIRGATIGLKSPSGIKKEDRLANGLKPYVNGGKVYLKDWMTEVYEQLWHFPKARNDDLLDGIYYAIAKLRAPKSEPIPIKDLKYTKEKQKNTRPPRYNWVSGAKIG